MDYGEFDDASPNDEFGAENEDAPNEPIPAISVAAAAAEMNLQKFWHFTTRGLVGNVHAGAVKCKLGATDSGCVRVSFDDYGCRAASGQFYSPTMVSLQQQPTRSNRTNLLSLPGHFLNCFSDPGFPYLPTSDIDRSTRTVADAISIFSADAAKQIQILEESNCMNVRIELFFRIVFDQDAETDDAESNVDPPTIQTLHVDILPFFEAIQVVKHAEICNFWRKHWEHTLTPLRHVFATAIHNTRSSRLDFTLFTPAMITALLFLVEKAMVSLNVFRFEGYIHKQLRQLDPDGKLPATIPNYCRFDLSANEKFISQLKYGVDPSLHALPPIAERNPTSNARNIDYNDDDAGLQSTIAGIGIFLPRTFFFSRSSAQLLLARFAMIVDILMLEGDGAVLTAERFSSFESGEGEGVPPNPGICDYPSHVKLSSLPDETRKDLFQRISMILWFVYRKEWHHILYKPKFIRSNTLQRFPAKSPNFNKFPLTDVMLQDMEDRHPLTKCETITVDATQPSITSIGKDSIELIPPPPFV